MKRSSEDFTFKVSDILVAPSTEQIEESKKIPIWKFEGLEDFEIIAPVQVNAKLQKIDQGTILGIFELNLEVRGQCSRCLEKIKKSIEFNSEGIFSVYDNVEEAEFKISKYGEINIQPLLEQEIITHLPQNFLCKENCKGLCPECGENLNQGKCKCKR